MVITLLLLLSCFNIGDAFFHSVPGIRQGRSLNMIFQWKEIRSTVETKMEKSIATMLGQFSNLRVGAANPSMLAKVEVEVDNQCLSLDEVASVSTAGAQMLLVEPFDKRTKQNILDAIVEAKLGLSPVDDGSGKIRLSLPPLTEDRRKSYVKEAKVMSEEGRVAVRNIRRDAVEKIKKGEKAKEIDKDNSKFYQDDVQKLTDEAIKKIDSHFKAKEKSLLSI